MALLIALGPAVAAADLTGEWEADDGGRYYLRQVGDRVFWYGERSARDPAWANVFEGRLRDGELRGEWADVPKGRARSQGRLRLDVRRRGNVLVAVDKTGGFGGSRWTRVGFNPRPAPRPPAHRVREDCVGFDPLNARVESAGGRWKIVDGSHWVFDFGSSRSEARRALRVIRHYRADQSCFVGRPDPSFQYLLSAGRAPSGPLNGEDCLSFDPRNTRVERVGGRWKIVEGSHWLFDFGGQQQEARDAMAIIRKHGFDHSCFVGRPDPSLQYLRK
jgi:hypothetical protein